LIAHEQEIFNTVKLKKKKIKKNNNKRQINSNYLWNKFKKLNKIKKTIFFNINFGYFGYFDIWYLFIYILKKKKKKPNFPVTTIECNELKPNLIAVGGEEVLIINI
jgi:hypothetical protein